MPVNLMTSKQITALLYPISHSSPHTPNRQEQVTAAITNSIISAAWRVYKKKSQLLLLAIFLPLRQMTNDSGNDNNHFLKLGYHETNFDERKQFPFLHDYARTTTRTTAFFFCSTRCLFGVCVLFDGVWGSDRHVYHVWSCARVEFAIFEGGGVF